jgi:AraC-like DNA-binding protein
MISLGKIESGKEILRLTEKQNELIALLSAQLKNDGVCQTSIDDLLIHRSSTPSEEFHYIQEPSFCVIAQGSKEVRLGDEFYRYDSARYLVASLDLPTIGRVTEASSELPYFCLRIKLAPSLVGELALEEEDGAAPLSAKPSCKEPLALAVSELGYDLLDAVIRLVRLLDSPRETKALAPLVLREIHYRLLIGEQGEMLRQITRKNSQTQRIAKAIYWMMKNLNRPFRIEDIAKEVAMSESGFHHQFKAITGLSPLQCQKQLRLYEARRMLMTGEADASTASYHVGYESPSQFSREYSRMFGAPPIRDVARQREAI